jgi:hypothetical protein
LIIIGFYGAAQPKMNSKKKVKDITTFTNNRTRRSKRISLASSSGNEETPKMNIIQCKGSINTYDWNVSGSDDELIQTKPGFANVNSDRGPRKKNPEGNWPIIQESNCLSITSPDLLLKL